MQSWTFDSQDPEQTLERGADLGRSIGADGLAIALVGPLGAGKTVFVKGLADGLGVDPRVVSSPTFVIAQQYSLPKGPELLHHIDLYRLATSEELDSIGFYDMLAPGQVVAVEWADRFPGVLGSAFLSIEFEGPSPAEDEAARQGVRWRGRRARVSAHGETAERVLADWASRVTDTLESGGGRVASSPEMRVLLALLFALAAFALGRLDFDTNEPACASLVETESDRLGTLRASCVETNAVPPSSLSGIARLLDGEQIELNEASVAVLERLPGIGPKRAGAIDRARLEAPFVSVEDLERASGIGPKTRARVARWLYVAERAAAKASPAKGSNQDG